MSDHEHHCRICTNLFWCERVTCSDIVECRDCQRMLDSLSPAAKGLFIILLQRIERLEK